MSFSADMAPELRETWVGHLLVAMDESIAEWKARKAMRAKFHVDSVTQFAYATKRAKLSAVHDGSAENNQFAAATPTGSMEIDVSNPAAMDFLQPGKSYYLDFTQAPE